MLAHDYLHNVLERPRQLSNYDLCLRQTDCDWHRPFIVRIHVFHVRNLRTRGPDSQKNRLEAARRRQERADQPTYGRNTGGYYRRDNGPYARSSGSPYPGWYGGGYKPTQRFNLLLQQSTFPIRRLVQFVQEDYCQDHG